MFNSPKGKSMSKLLSVIFAAVFAAVTVTPVAFAQIRRTRPRRK
jgi:hypothetical protein